MKQNPLPFSTPGASKTRPLLLGLACLAALAVTVLSFLPSRDKDVLHTNGHLHDWGHLLCFAFITFVGVRGVRTSRARFVVVACVVVLGALLEFGESQVFHNALETSDIVFDTAGVLLGALAAAPRPTA